MRALALAALACLTLTSSSCAKLPPANTEPSANEDPPAKEAPAADEASSAWAQALMVDGSEAGRTRVLETLEELRETQPPDAGAPLLDQLDMLVADPGLDPEGELRSEMAMTLGVLGVSEAVPLLIGLLQQPPDSQPKRVYAGAIEALGLLRDPAAVEPLIRVQFAVPDRPGTQSIGERAVRAIGAIGKPAVPPLVRAMEGDNPQLNAQFEALGIDREILVQASISMLGVVGSPTALPSLLGQMPLAGCEGGPAKSPDDDEYRDVSRRAFVARALGNIGDRTALQALCACQTTSGTPMDMWEIAQALARIGGKQAFACLSTLAQTGAYHPDAVSSDYEHEIRWEAVGLATLAAPPAQAGDVTKIIDASKGKVAKEIAARPWASGVAVLERCGEQVSCYEQVMGDAASNWFEREVAAVNFARRSTPGDIEAAAKLARAFDIPDPSARVNLAWLTAKVAAGERCPECVAALEAVMEAERDVKDVRMQAPWLGARQTIAKLR